MSTWLIALVGLIYLYVAGEMAYNGKWALAMVWFGYAFAQVGLWIVSTK